MRPIILSSAHYRLRAAQPNNQVLLPLAKFARLMLMSRRCKLFQTVRAAERKLCACQMSLFSWPEHWGDHGVQSVSCTSGNCLNWRPDIYATEICLVRYNEHNWKPSLQSCMWYAAWLVASAGAYHEGSARYARSDGQRSPDGQQRAGYCLELSGNPIMSLHMHALYDFASSYGLNGELARIQISKTRVHLKIGMQDSYSTTIFITSCSVKLLACSSSLSIYRPAVGYIYLCCSWSGHFEYLQFLFLIFIMLNFYCQ